MYKIWDDLANEYLSYSLVFNNSDSWINSACPEKSQKPNNSACLGNIKKHKIWQMLELTN